MLLKKIEMLCKKAYKGEAEVSEDIIEAFGEACKQAFKKHFTPHEVGFKIRMSSIGKPVRYLQCDKLGLDKDEEESYNTSIKFLYGDIAEAILISLLKAVKADIKEEQKAVTLPIADIELSGTYDIKLGNKIYDIKSCSPYAYDNKFRDFESVLAGDDFGYVAQIYLYPEAETLMSGKKVHAGGWLVINKVTGEIKEIKVPIEDDKIREEQLSIVSSNIKILNNTKTLDDIDKSIPTQKETYYGKQTGETVLSDSYKYFNYKKVLWKDTIEFRTGKSSKTKKWYVTQA